MTTIYKYPIEVTDQSSIETHEGAKFLRVGNDPQGTLCVWCEVDTKKRKERRAVFVVGTGGEVPVGPSYLGSVNQGPFVWHIYVM